MVDVGSNETALFFEGWVSVCVACPRLSRIVVIVAPFSEMVGELKTRSVRGCVLKINDNELSVSVFGE